MLSRLCLSFMGSKYTVGMVMHVVVILLCFYDVDVLI